MAPASARHLRTAAVLRHTHEAGYTMIRDAAGLDAGFKLAIDEGLIAARVAEEHVTHAALLPRERRSTGSHRLAGTVMGRQD